MVSVFALLLPSAFFTLKVTSCASSEKLTLTALVTASTDSTLFEKCQDLSITHKNYNNLRIIFNTANPKLAHFNITYSIRTVT
jgi:hypothetical protein